MKHFFVTILALALLFFVSCNISQEYSFNKDFSGTSNLEIDISQLIDYISIIDSTNSFNPKKQIDSLGNSFFEIASKLSENGATNVKYGRKNNNKVLFISYKFKDINTLNNILATDEAGELFGSGKITRTERSNAKFTKKNKRKLSYNAPEVTNDSLFKKDEIASMKDYYSYKLKFNFATKIKRLTSKYGQLSSDKKTVEFSGSLIDIYSSDYSSDFEVKLKRK